MKGHATIQCRAKLSKGGIRRLDGVRSILNRLYNAALEERRTAWESEQRGVTLYDQMKGLTSQRKDDPEGLGSVAVKAERGMLMRLDRAFQAFFRRCKAGEKPGYPRFRPLARMETIDIVDPKATVVKKRARGYAIRPKGFPTIRVFPSRPLPDGCPLKALRIVRKPNRVYVDLTYEVEKPPLPKCESSVGIDLGVRKRAVLSTGERIERKRRDWGEIRKQQRKVSRCKKISKTRRKRIVQLSRLRHRESVRNRNACHRLSSRIIREHGLIAVEKLNIQGMVTKGSKKKGLNREILTQSWGLLRNQLQYKAEWAGREFVEVNPAYTSQDCHRCGARHDPGRSETFRCRACGLGMDRDHNAALNILRAGVLALGTGTYLVGESVVPELYAKGT